MQIKPVSELKKKLVFWRVMSIITALGGILYFVKYDVDIVFIIILLVFALMYHMTKTIDKILKG